MGSPIALSVDGFVATLLACSLIYARKTMKSQRERTWIYVFLSIGTFLLGSILQFYSDLEQSSIFSPFLASAVPASALMVAALVYSYYYVSGNKTLLDQVVQTLRSHRFNVREGGSVLGRSGVEHQFDILAEGNNMTIVADVKNSILRVGELPVIRLFTKAADLAVPRPVLVAKPSLTGSARRLADTYHITVIEGPSFADLVGQLDSFLSQGPSQSSV